MIQNLPLGLLSSVGVGFFGGSVLAPQHFTRSVAQGIGFLPSFAIGVLIMAPVVTLATAALERRVPRFKSRQDFFLALAAGTSYRPLGARAHM